MKENTPTFIKLENDPVWKEASDIAEFMYGKLEEFPEEEKWETQRKLRSAANDLLFTVSQASGDASPSGTEYQWGMARRHASALKAMYRFAGRQKFIELDPQMMVRLDRLITNIESRVKGSYKQTEDHNQSDMETWRKRYKMWKETNL
jgi:hypothetical protein